MFAKEKQDWLFSDYGFALKSLSVEESKDRLTEELHVTVLNNMNNNYNYYNYYKS